MARVRCPWLGYAVSANDLHALPLLVAARLLAASPFLIPAPPLPPPPIFAANHSQQGCGKLPTACTTRSSKHCLQT